MPLIDRKHLLKEPIWDTCSEVDAFLQLPSWGACISPSNEEEPSPNTSLGVSKSIVE